MKKLSLLVLFLVLVVPAYARLGEDLKQLEKRYGTLKKEQTQSGWCYWAVLKDMNICFYMKGEKTVRVKYVLSYYNAEKTMETAGSIRKGLKDFKGKYGLSILELNVIDVWDVKWFPDKKPENALKTAEL